MTLPRRTNTAGNRLVACLLLVSLLFAACLRDNVPDPTPSPVAQTHATATRTESATATPAPAQETLTPTTPREPSATPSQRPARATATATSTTETTTLPTDVPADQIVDLPDVELAYDIDATLTDFDTGHVEATSTVRVTSREDAALDELFFRVAPARDGMFSLGDVTRDGVDAEVDASDGGTTLAVALDPPLAPGEAAEIRIDFTLDIVETLDSYASTGRDGPVLRMGYWYPMLSNDAGYPPILDPPYTRSASYQMRLTASGDVVVASSGGVGNVQPGTDGAVTYSWALEHGRDIALMLSRDYVVYERTAENGVVMQMYLIPEQLRMGFTSALAVEQTFAIAERSLVEFSERVGPYPWPSLAIVDGGPSLGGGIEYTALTIVNFSAGWLEVLVAHEIAHMWFYAMIGTRTQDDPWVDEGAATFMSEGMLGGYAGVNDNPFVRYAAPLGTSIPELAHLSDNDWINAVYAQGAAFYSDAYNAMGPDAFWAAMREVYDTYRFEIITPWDLLTTLQRHSPVDLGEVFERYVVYEWAGAEG